MNAPTVTKDKLTIKKEGNGFVLSRHIEENLSRAELKKRITDFENEKKRLNNEKEKALNALQQIHDAMEETEQKIEALNKALNEGFVEM